MEWRRITEAIWPAWDRGDRIGDVLEWWCRFIAEWWRWAMVVQWSVSLAVVDAGGRSGRKVFLRCSCGCAYRCNWPVVGDVGFALWWRGDERWEIGGFLLFFFVDLPLFKLPLSLLMYVLKLVLWGERWSLCWVDNGNRNWEWERGKNEMVSLRFFFWIFSFVIFC